MTEHPKIILLFGEMGAGKSYFGKKLAQSLNLKFVEGDDLLPDDMKKVVAKFGTPTDEMLHNLVYNLRAKISEMVETEDIEGVVVSQALYSRKNRNKVLSFWRWKGFAVYSVWVKVPFWENFRQLLNRDRPIRWMLYWLRSKPFFQKPLDQKPFEVKIDSYEY